MMRANCEVVFFSSVLRDLIGKKKKKKSFQETNFSAVAEFERAMEITGLKLRFPFLPHMP